MGKISSNVPLDHKLQVPFTTVFGRKEKLKGSFGSLGFSAKVYEHTNTVQPHSEQVGVVSEWKKLCVYSIEPTSDQASP